MADQDFEKKMDTWADHEVASAPEMSPTPDMYRLVRARQRKFRALTFRRWATLGAAVASLVIVAVLYVAVYQPAFLFGGPSGVQTAHVKLREGFAAEKGVVVVGTPRGKGPQRGPACLGQLAFQYQRQDSSTIEAIDLLTPSPGTVALTSEDNYRMHLEPLRACHVYVFQRTPSGDLVRLFPGEAFGPLGNPMRGGQAVYVPSEPNWLYVEGSTGEHRLYVVVSTQAIAALDDLYARYVRARPSQKPQALAHLVNALDAGEAVGAEGAQRRTFTFTHR